MNRQRLADAIAGALKMPISVPAHAVGRIWALLGDEDPFYVDARLKPVDPGGYSGQIVVMTKRRVILADLEKAKTPHPRERAEYTVTVRTWARQALSEVSIDPLPDIRANSDDRWLEDHGKLWPDGALVTVHYTDPPVSLTLPLTENPTKAQRELLATAVLPGLLQDVE